MKDHEKPFDHLDEIERLLAVRERCARLSQHGDGLEILPHLGVLAAQRLRQLVPAPAPLGE